jgi:hypothetical protein
MQNFDIFHSENFSSSLFLKSFFLVLTEHGGDGANDKEFPKFYFLFAKPNPHSFLAPILGTQKSHYTIFKTIEF